MMTQNAPAVRSELRLRSFGSVRDPEILLYCFPYAGGNATFYHPWTALLPRHVGLHAIQLPARQDLLDVPPFRRMDDLASAAARLVAEHARGRRHLFLGHSMGAVLAFETARRLRRDGRELPELIALSGARAAHRERRLPLFEGLDDDELLTAVEQLGGIPPQIAASAELRPLIVPAIRADFALLADHRHRAEPPLECAAAVFGGTADDLVPAEDLHAWGEHFTGPVTVEQFPGGHFYLSKWASRVLSSVLARA
ncbi:pyochelin biosynthetic protein PchC [Streptomyces inusitatus]|uniref:Pyochelin biosynthetic protein PchC n=1 Tax=Streptomyces inusitatus TaxID=68221 RepID=A0A918UKD5_9ACTN|nr:alpha/beta fold hydrolase [Streptomyces inusitatus]GGZ16199.1 pyochelin biosynthetic protein PchC [Streptomyces inusitatus]